MSSHRRCRTIGAKDGDDQGPNPTGARPMRELIEARLSRRGLLKGVAAGALAGGLFGRVARGKDDPSSLRFAEIAHGIDGTHHVAPGHAAEVLIRWGDALAKDAPAFDPRAQSAAAQAKQFGYNCDFTAYMPLPAGSGNSEHGLLCVNHEYVSTALMFPGEGDAEPAGRQQAEIQMAAHGHSVVEIRKDGGTWRIVADGPYNRRITANGTRMRIAGPAAGHERLRTRADRSGREVIGTLSNCAGGSTPWGTVLIAEENFSDYFGNVPKDAPQAEAYRRYGISSDCEYTWWRYQDRFDVTKEPNEPNRFGWVVELDPYDPRSIPVKRTALGRFKHEGAQCIVNGDGRVVIYSGDDENFEYIYKFVTARGHDPRRRAANRDLLDDGTLYVARFFEDGRLRWLPLVFGHGPLTPENGFHDQAEVLIEARRAADLLGATPMDRPEDIEPNPVNGRVYAMLTKNKKRRPEQVDAANPRPENRAGHIIEIVPPGGRGPDADHAATDARWGIFLIAGDPASGTTLYGAGTGANGWFACPDNAAIDGKGRLWITTDQGGGAARTGTCDGVWATDVDGDGRATPRFFFRAPIGAEICGPSFTPDGRTLFLSIQHPGDVDGSSFDAPATRWPDFIEGMPPRPSVVAVTRLDGGRIGG